MTDSNPKATAINAEFEAEVAEDKDKKVNASLNNSKLNDSKRNSML